MAQLDKGTILLIAPEQGEVCVSGKDRLGGQEHGAIEWTRRLVAKPADVDQFAERLSTSISNAANILQEALGGKVGGYSVEEIAVSLAVTADGNIGIATAGVEASVEVTLKRNHEKPKST